MRRGVRRWAAPRWAVAFGVLALGAGLAACGGERGDDAASELARRIGARPTGVKVLVVGIDGATFTVLDPLLAAGELPAFARLAEEGARGPLESQRPILSPAIWTTLATGLDRQEHGIKRFTVKDEASGSPVLVNSTLRRRLAVWDMVSAAGLDVGVAGWWCTWPAEPVRGWMVSDRMTRSRWSEWTDGSKDRFLTFPPELAGELGPLVLDPMEPRLEELRTIVDLSPQEETELLAAEKPLRAHALSVLKFAWATQRTYEQIALELLDRGQPDFGAVFLIANDPISHTFWHQHEPQRYDFGDGGPNPGMREAVRNIYRHNDRYLAELLRRVDDDTVVFVVSDHGFRGSGRLPSERHLESDLDVFDDRFESDEDTVTVGQSGVHHLDGILLAAGGPVRRARIERASVLDLVPTVLALLGLPVPDDLPGRVLEEILDPEFLERYPVRTIPTWERLVDRDALRVDLEGDPVDAERLEMLKSLGYVD